MGDKKTLEDYTRRKSTRGSGVVTDYMRKGKAAKDDGKFSELCEKSHRFPRRKNRISQKFIERLKDELGS